MTGTSHTPAAHPTDWTIRLQEPPIPCRATLRRAAAERCEQDARADAEALFFFDGGDDFLKACALVGEIQRLTARPGARLPKKIAQLAAEVRDFDPSADRHRLDCGYYGTGRCDRGRCVFCGNQRQQRHCPICVERGRRGPQRSCSGRGISHQCHHAERHANAGGQLHVYRADCRWNGKRLPPVHDECGCGLW